MVTFEEAKQKISDVINKIDGYIQALLNDIVTWRLNRINGAVKALSEFRTKVLDNWALNYEQKTVFDKMATIRKGELAPATLTKPSLSFSYNADIGGWTELVTEEGTMKVPYVPKFVQVPYILDTLTDEVIKKFTNMNIYLIVKDLTGIVESPDITRNIEPSPLYYYKIPIYSRSYVSTLHDFGVTYKIVHEDKVISFSQMYLSLYEEYKRTLAIAGESREMLVQVYRGQLSCTVDGQTDVKLEGALIAISFPTSRESAVEIFNKQIGLKTDDNIMYYRKLVIVRMRNLWYLYEVD